VLLDLFRQAFPEQPAATLEKDIGMALEPMIEGGLLVETGPN